MEEYLQYMKTLRCQMNDVEDHAAKISFEEQTLITGIQALEDDLSSVKLEMQKLGDELEQIAKAKAQICFQLLEVQRKVSALESDSCMLIQSLELMQQERASLSAKLVDQSAFYTKVAEELNAKFQEQLGQGNEEVKRHKLNLRTAITRFNEIRGVKAQIVAENAEMKEYVMQMKGRASDFKQELREMDVENLEKGPATISSEKVGETEWTRCREMSSCFDGIDSSPFGTEANVTSFWCNGFRIRVVRDGTFSLDNRYMHHSDREYCMMSSNACREEYKIEPDRGEHRTGNHREKRYYRRNGAMTSRSQGA